MTLARYFAKRFLVSFAAVLLAIGMMILLIDFLTNLSRLNGLDSPVKNALILGLYRTLTYLSLAMPLIIMLSGLAFSVGVARSSEFVVSRAAGLSALRSLFSVTLCAFLLGVISVFLIDPMAGRMVTLYDTKLNQLKGIDNQAVLINDSGYWMRQSAPSGHQIIKANSVSDNGRVLSGISVYNFDHQGDITDRTFAQAAFLYSGEWVLTQGERWVDDVLAIDPSRAATTFKIIRIPTNITPQQLLAGYPAPETLSPFEMPDQITRVRDSGFSTLKYQSHQMGQYARPVLFAVMVLLGSVFTLQNARMGNVGVSVVSSVVCGFGLHFLQNFATTLGRSGEIPLPIATWSPILCAGLVVIALFLHYEDG
jgi:lipopolysaccharide export system permease protein